MAKQQHKYILVDRQQQPSRLNGVQMWRLTFYCLDDGTTWDMTVDSSYRNFKRQGWDHVVEDPRPWGVYQGLRRTDRVTRDNRPVLTADGQAELIYRCEDQDEADQLVLLNEQEIRPTPFERMFD